MKVFKGKPVCKIHGIVYDWGGICALCKKKGKRKVEEVLTDMMEKGIIPNNKNDKNTNNNS